VRCSIKIGDVQFSLLSIVNGADAATAAASIQLN
jgi:hypothetical protein